MKDLFAPWRMTVLEEYKKTNSCILCGIFKAKDDKEALIIDRRKNSFLVMNKYPYANGHMMIVPNRHIGDWTKLTEEELLEMNLLSQEVIKVLGSSFQAQGYNMGVNLGRAAGAGIKEHVHMHIVPRWNGDFNFMPVLGEVRVISEHLEATYEKFKKVWRTES